MEMINLLPANPQSLFGIKILVNPLAVQRKGFVEKHPRRKKRKNWRVKIVEGPCAYMMEAINTLVVHPEVYEKLKRQAEGAYDDPPDSELRPAPFEETTLRPSLRWDLQWGLRPKDDPFSITKIVSW